MNVTNANVVHSALNITYLISLKRQHSILYKGLSLQMDLKSFVENAWGENIVSAAHATAIANIGSL